MTGKPKFLLALAALYSVLGGLTAIVYYVAWAVLNADEKRAILQVLDERMGTVVYVLLLVMAVLGMLFDWLYRRYVTAPLQAAEHVLVMLEANRELRLQPTGAAEVCRLVRAVNQLADQRDALQRDMAEKIRDAGASVEEEKNRFAALMSELVQSVVVCNLDGRILLYNSRARLLFPARRDSALIGLGRSIFSVIERSLITHGLDKIGHDMVRGIGQPCASFVTTTPAGALIRVQMAPVLGARQREAQETAPAEGAPIERIGGYVLILENITRSFEVESRRDQMLQSLTEGSRASLGSIRAAVENLLDDPAMDAGQRDRFLGVLRDEVTVMGRRLDQSVTEFADALKARWPLEEMLGFDLIQAAQRRIEQRLELPTKLEEIDDTLWIKVDSFSLLQGLSYLAARLKDEFQVREVRFRLARVGRLAHLDLIWTGTVIGTETLVSWELESMKIGGENNPLTLREVVERHGGELWFQRDKASHRAFFRMLIPATAAPETGPEAVPHSESRPEYYDFDLFRQTEETRALDERLLTQLTYTAFDTETTGLEPSAGDEIIQIGATRIVNGRLLKTDVFDQMVNSRRRIAPESVRIHGISNDMLRGQPPIAAVLPEFHAFCEDTVLVAHNAAFDMRFLQMQEERTGVVFRQPVLDTLMLSAVIHPNQELHRLEDIAERLGVNTVGRHTALGDAIVTGEVFLKMIPLLAEKGIRTLRDAREASERTYYAKVKY